MDDVHVRSRAHVPAGPVTRRERTVETIIRIILYCSGRVVVLRRTDRFDLSRVLSHYKAHGTYIISVIVVVVGSDVPMICRESIILSRTMPK